MNYELRFLPSAKREWDKLDKTIAQQFKKILARRLENPHIASAALHNLPNCYKIKLRSVGYRLVYQVNDHVITVTVVAIGKRENAQVYQAANSRLSSKIS